MDGLFPNLLDIFKIAVTFTANGGWVLFVIGMIYMLWRLYFLEIQHQYVHSQKWVFLQFKVPRENRISTLAVENIFSQMHALHVGKTFAERFVEGQIQLWYSLEIVSLGGKISFLMRIPAHTRDVVESAFYAYYPQAEISEVSDYMENFYFDPDEPGDMEVFGSEWKLNESDVIPIKTYKDFEHPTAEEKVIDPLANFFEGLTKVKPHEFIGFQIIIQPLADDHWQPKGLLKVKELTGEEVPHERKLSDILLAPFTILSHKSAIQAFRESGHGAHGHEDELQRKPRNNWMSMTEAEKQRVTLIESKISKPGYKTKIRMIYITPKDKFDNARKGLMSGLYRPLGSVMTNKLRPDVSNTWVTADYKFSRTLEQPYLDWQIRLKKRRIFKGYKERDIHIGLPMFMMNIEELATLYHFPITTETTTVNPAIEQTLSKTSQPPANLPIAEE
jgi:hypothetical protein